MSLEITFQQRPLLNAIEVLAIIALVCDSLIGIIASVPFDLHSVWQMLNAVLFVSAAPLYTIRLRSMKMAIVSLWVLFVTRWVVLCFDGNPPGLCNPIAWPIGPFLFAALMLLQIAYIAKNRAANIG